MAGPDAFAFGHCETLVREGDPDRFWASLFAPADKRPSLQALHAFSLEVARIREVIRDPMAGEIRLQWWRDAVHGDALGDAGAHPVAAALAETIERFRLPRQAFVDLIDARAFDLYDDPMPTLADLEGYCGETSSSLFRLAMLILADSGDPGGADAAGHGGVAYALTGLLRAFPFHARRGQVYLPQDALARHAVVREDIVTGRGGPGLAGVLAEMRVAVRRHLEETRRSIGTIDSAAMPALRPLALIELFLRLMERPGYDPFSTIVELPQWRRLWALGRGFR